MVTRLIVVPLLQALRLGSLTPLAQTLDELTLFFLALLSQLKMGLLGCLDAMLYPIQVADMAAGKLHQFCDDFKKSNGDIAGACIVAVTKDGRSSQRITQDEI